MEGECWQLHFLLITLISNTFSRIEGNFVTRVVKYWDQLFIVFHAQTLIFVC